MEGILRYKNTIVILAIIALFAVVDYNLITDYFKQIEELEQRELDLELSKITLQEWDNTSYEFREVSKGFLREDVHLFKKFIDNKASQYDIDIKALRTSKEDREFYWEANMDLVIKCSYADFIKFISAIEVGSLEVRKVSILSKRISHDVDISLTLRGYILKK